MKKLTLAALLATALAGLPGIANAAGVYLCAPIPSVGAAGPRVVTPLVSPSVAAISFDANGCALVPNASVSWFLSQGFLPRPSSGSVGVGPFTFASGVASPTVVLPPNSYITQILFDNSAGAGAASSGVRVGTAQTTGDVVALVSAAAGQISFTVDSAGAGVGTASGGGNTLTTPSATWNLAKRAFTGQQTLFIDTPGAWGTSALSVTVYYNRF